MSHRTRLVVIAYLLVVSANQTSHAAITVFQNDLVGWQQAIGQIEDVAVNTIGFDDIAVTDNIPVVFDADHYVGQIDSPLISLVRDASVDGATLLVHQGMGEEVPVSPPNALGISTALGATVRVTFDQPIYGMGGMFLDVEPQGVGSTGFDVNLDGVPDAMFSSPPGDYSQAFLGFVSDELVSAVDIHFATTPINDGDGISVDDLMYAVTSRPHGSLLAIKITDATSSPIPNSEISYHEVSQFIDPVQTRWIAWNHSPTVDSTDPQRPNQSLLGRSIGVNDFIRLTVINPEGQSLTLDIDQNTAAAESYGPQAVIYGSSELAPDVLRENPILGTLTVFDESGSHNPIFTTAGTYEFQFSLRNTIGSGGHNGMWLLIDTDSSSNLGSNLLHNSNFEETEETVGLPTDFQDWGGDTSQIVPEQDGIKPLGNEMFRFDGTSSGGEGGRTGDVVQFVDLSPFQDLVREGKAVALLTADFNRVVGDAETDNEFLVLVAAHNGTPAASPGNSEALGYVSHSVNSDADPATWQESAVEFEIPTDASFLQVTLSAIENIFDDTAPPEFDGHFADHASLIIFVRGDFNFDGNIQADDIDRISQTIRENGYDRFMDLDKNDSVNFLDRQLLISEFIGTSFGDSNLDGVFDSGDLVQVFQAGEYEDGIAGNSGWAEGDFGGDGEFSSDDLVLAFQTGAYEKSQTPILQVPEPPTLNSFPLFALCISLTYRRIATRERPWRVVTYE